MRNVLWLDFDDPLCPEHQRQGPRRDEAILKSNEATEMGEPIADDGSKDVLCIVQGIPQRLRGRRI